MPKQKTDASRMRRALRTSVVIIGIFTLAFAVFWPPTTKADDHAFIVAAAQTIWEEGIDLKTVGCLTLNRKIGNHIYGKDFSDDPKILEISHKYFPNKDISSKNPSCHYVFTFVIFVADTHAVKYAGRISRMMMSFIVTEKNPITDELDVNSSHIKREYKNLYLFRSDLKALEAFEVGLKAFVTPQNKEWEVMRISLSGA